MTATPSRIEVNQTVGVYCNNQKGDDITGDGTALKPYGTLAAAINYVCDRLMINNNHVYIYCWPTGIRYGPTVLRNYVGSVMANITNPVICPDPAAPPGSPDVILDTVTSVCAGPPWIIQDCQHSSLKGHALNTDWGSSLYLRRPKFGPCPNGYFMALTWQAKLEILVGPWAILDDAVAQGWALLVQSTLVAQGANDLTIGARVRWTNVGLQITRFSALFINNIRIVSGSVTGPRIFDDGKNDIVGIPGGGQALMGDSDFPGTAVPDARSLVLVDANFQIAPSMRFISLAAILTAPRTWFMPKSSTLPPGIPIELSDGGGVNGSNIVTIQAAAGDIFTDGTTTMTISTRGGKARLAGAGAGYLYKLS